MQFHEMVHIEPKSQSFLVCEFVIDVNHLQLLILELEDNHVRCLDFANAGILLLWHARILKLEGRIETQIRHWCWKDMLCGGEGGSIILSPEHAIRLQELTNENKFGNIYPSQ